MTITWPALLAALAAAAAGWGLHQARAQTLGGPFQLLARQTEPAVTLFVHRATRTCFVGYQPGGLVIVPRALCDHVPPVIPPVGPPVSPER